MTNPDDTMRRIEEALDYYDDQWKDGREKLLATIRAALQPDAGGWGEDDDRHRANEEHERAVALKPQSAEAHYNLGVFYELHRKDMGRALAQYRRYRDLGGRDERVERIIGMGGP